MCCALRDSFSASVPLRLAMKLLCVLLALAPGLAAAGCAGVNGVKDGPRVNLQEKLSSTQGNSAGADWYNTAKTAVLYLYVNVNRASDFTTENDFMCKVAIHEYQHLLQQGFLSKKLT